MAAIKKADPVARRNVIIFVLLLALGIFLSEKLIAHLNDWIVSDPDKVTTRVYIYVLYLLAISVPLWIGAIYLWRVAKQAITSGEFPPPTVGVIVDTTIQTGRTAVIRARQLQVAAVLIIAMSVIGPIGLVIILKRLIAS